MKVTQKISGLANQHSKLICIFSIKRSLYAVFIESKKKEKKDQLDFISYILKRQLVSFVT